VRGDAPGLGVEKASVFTAYAMPPPPRDPPPGKFCLAARQTLPIRRDPSPSARLPAVRLDCPATGNSHASMAMHAKRLCILRGHICGE
jgi:hypothetical protein